MDRFEHLRSIWTGSKITQLSKAKSQTFCHAASRLATASPKWSIVSKMLTESLIKRTKIVGTTHAKNQNKKRNKTTRYNKTNNTKLQYSSHEITQTNRPQKQIDRTQYLNFNQIFVRNIWIRRFVFDQFSTDIWI